MDEMISLDLFSDNFNKLRELLASPTPDELVWSENVPPENVQSDFERIVQTFEHDPNPENIPIEEVLSVESPKSIYEIDEASEDESDCQPKMPTNGRLHMESPDLFSQLPEDYTPQRGLVEEDCQPKMPTNGRLHMESPDLFSQLPEDYSAQCELVEEDCQPKMPTNGRLHMESPDLFSQLPEDYTAQCELVEEVKSPAFSPHFGHRAKRASVALDDGVGAERLSVDGSYLITEMVNHDDDNGIISPSSNGPAVRLRTRNVGNVQRPKTIAAVQDVIKRPPTTPERYTPLMENRNTSGSGASTATELVQLEWRMWKECIGVMDVPTSVYVDPRLWGHRTGIGKKTYDRPNPFFRLSSMVCVSGETMRKTIDTNKSTNEERICIFLVTSDVIATDNVNHILHSNVLVAKCVPNEKVQSFLYEPLARRPSYLLLKFIGSLKKQLRSFTQLHLIFGCQDGSQDCFHRSIDWVGRLVSKNIDLIIQDTIILKNGKDQRYNLMSN